MEIKNVKPKYIILSAVGLAVLISFIGKKITDIRRSNTAKKSYGDENIATAQRLFNAMFPDGRSDAKFSFFNPFSTLGIVKDVFKASADTDKIMEIARDDITTDNFRKIASGYHKLYSADLIFDLQNRLDDDYTHFDEIIKNKKQATINPGKHNKVLDNLAELIYTDVYSWGWANDELYQTLFDLSDSDFIYVYNQFQIIADREGTHDSLAKEIADDSWSIDLDEELAARFLKLGLR